MSTLKQEYNELIEEIRKNAGEMKKLECDEKLKRYFKLKDRNESLCQKQIDLYTAIKKEEYASCKHILVYSKIEYDREEGRKYRRCGCIKCGLDSSVLDFQKENLSFDRKIMYEYFKEINFFENLNGIQTKIACDLYLAQAICKKIQEAHPCIDDKMLAKYFEIALDDIRNIEVNDDRKVSRAKRLSLNPKFKRWNSQDVCTD